ncbi:MAG: C39 family peptidase [Bacilli bacterium]|nr:C39 family peptidase [Bacilli bacterium]
MGFSATRIDVKTPEANNYVNDYNATFDADNTVKSVEVESVDFSKEVEKVEDVELAQQPKVEEVKVEEVSSSFEKPDIKEIIDNASKEVDTKYDEKPSSNLKEHKFVNYYQGDYNNPYSEGTIATSGCGPTSAAMALTYITGKEVSPVETAEFGNGDYTCSEGTYWTYFGDVSAKYGVKCNEEHVSADNIKKGLSDGKPVIISMGPGHFTSAGHFIVLRSIDGDGNVKVADPASKERSSETWSLDTIVSEGKEIWTFNL